MARKLTSQSVAKTLAVIENREKRADAKRRESNNILDLGGVMGMSKTQAEEVFEKINLNSGVMTESLSLDDLTRFANAINRLKDDFENRKIRGGIHPRTIINQSRKIDVDRAQEQIRTVIPARYTKEGVIFFRTNASNQSKDTHHMVSVQFLNFQAALTGGNITNALAIAVLKGAVRFDCDCGRHRFWYRYIATVGGYAFGKPETGFPKIRNPELGGIACKHVISTMTAITKSPALINKMRTIIGEIRANPTAKRRTLGKKQADELEKIIKAEKWVKQTVHQMRNDPPPKDLALAFKVTNKHSLAGTGVTPQDLAKAKAEHLSKQEILREITLALNDPSKMSNLPINELMDFYTKLQGK